MNNTSSFQDSSSPVRDALSTLTGRPLRIVDGVEFAGPVTFEQLSETPLQLVPKTTTTPSVLNLQRLKFQNTSSVTITNFVDGQEGQYIIIIGDGQTIVTHGTNIFNAAGANITLSNNKVYAYVRVQGVWREQGGVPTPNLSFSSNSLTSNVTLVNATTWYDIISLSLAAGTWLLTSITQFRSTHPNDVLYGCRISDGTNHFASSQAFAHNKNPNAESSSLSCIITLASTTTVKLQAITDVSGSVVFVNAATPNNASGNTATQLTALRIA